jgi:Tfp pilus assembly protein PilF
MGADLILSRAMRASTKLLEAEQYDKALNLLDEAIKDAMKTGGKTSWIPTVCNHAAVVAGFAGRHDLVKHYYEQSLASDPRNPRALYGVAKHYLEHGDVRIAKSFATKCFDAIQNSTDQKGKGLLELLVKQWPDIGA